MVGWIVERFREGVTGFKKLKNNQLNHMYGFGFIVQILFMINKLIIYNRVKIKYKSVFNNLFICIKIERGYLISETASFG